MQYQGCKDGDARRSIIQIIHFRLIIITKIIMYSGC